jgi:hypothetical protein
MRRGRRHTALTAAFEGVAPTQTRRTRTCVQSGSTTSQGACSANSCAAAGVSALLAHTAAASWGCLDWLIVELVD